VSPSDVDSSYCQPGSVGSCHKEQMRNERVRSISQDFLKEIYWTQKMYYFSFSLQLLFQTFVLR
jgi:hypothetical protein